VCVCVCVCVSVCLCVIRQLSCRHHAGFNQLTLYIYRAGGQPHVCSWLPNEEGCIHDWYDSGTLEWRTCYSMSWWRLAKPRTGTAYHSWIGSKQYALVLCSACLLCAPPPAKFCSSSFRQVGLPQGGPVSPFLRFLGSRCFGFRVGRRWRTAPGAGWGTARRAAARASFCAAPTPPGLLRPPPRRFLRFVLLFGLLEKLIVLEPESEVDHVVFLRLRKLRTLPSPTIPPPPPPPPPPHYHKRYPTFTNPSPAATRTIAGATAANLHLTTVQYYTNNYVLQLYLLNNHISTRGHAALWYATLEWLWNRIETL